MHSRLVNFCSEDIRWNSSGVDNFFWPLNRLSSKKLYETLLLRYVALARKNKNEDSGDFLIIVLNFFSLVNSVLSAENFQNALRKNNLKPVFPEKHVLWKAAYAGDYTNLPPMFTGDIDKGLGPPVSIVSSVKRRLRPWKDNTSPLKGFKRSHLGLYNPDRDIACTSYCSVARHMQKQTGKPVHLIALDEWFYPSSSARDVLPVHNFSLIDDILQDVRQVAAEFDITVSEASFAYMRHWLAYNMGWVKFYRRRIETLNIPVPRTLWAGSLGNVFNRMLAQFVREKGGFVQVHDHGEGGSYSQDLFLPFRELNQASRFVTFSDHQASQYRNNASTILIGNDKPEIMAIQPEDHIFKRWHKPFPRSKGKIVLYPCPLINLDVMGAVPLASAMEAIDWQARLFDHLNKAGFTVWFKPHPLTFHPFPDYGKVFNVIKKDEAFESVMDQADHILFDWTLTTTFGNAFKTDKPITVLDFDLARYSEDEKVMLGQRCTLVKGWFDADNRMQTDWNQLIRALTGLS